MDFGLILERAIQIKQIYMESDGSHYGKVWAAEDIALGFVGDVGDLMKLVVAKRGLRDIEDVDAKLSHELCDCLWSVLVLAHLYHIDLEVEFGKMMDDLERRIMQR